MHIGLTTLTSCKGHCINRKVKRTVCFQSYWIDNSSKVYTRIYDSTKCRVIAIFIRGQKVQIGNREYNDYHVLKYTNSVKLKLHTCNSTRPGKPWLKRLLHVSVLITSLHSRNRKEKQLIYFKAGQNKTLVRPFSQWLFVYFEICSKFLPNINSNESFECILFSVTLTRQVTF